MATNGPGSSSSSSQDNGKRISSSVPLLLEQRSHPQSSFKAGHPLYRAQKPSYYNMSQPLIPDQPMSHKLMDIVCCSEKLVWAWTNLGRDYTPDICVTATADSTAPPQHWWRISWRELEPQNLLLSLPNPHLTYILNQKLLNCPERETRNMYWVQFSLSLTSFTKFSFASHSVILLSLCRFRIVTTFLPGKLICSSSFFTLLVA